MFKKFSITILLLFCTKSVHASNLSASFVDTQGNTVSRSINVEGTLNFEQETSEQEIKGGILYGESDRKVTSRYWHGSIRDQHDLFKKPFYWTTFSKAESDPFAGYDLRLSVNIGLGMAFKNDIHEFKIDAGPGAVYEQLRYNLPPSVKDMFGDDVKIVDFYAVARAYERYKVQITPRISFMEEGEYIRDIEDSDNYWANGEVAVTGKINEYLSVKIGPKIKYANQPPLGTKRTDIITAATVIFYF
jgi:putative salt-induced outer membrane protein YdiY